MDFWRGQISEVGEGREGGRQIFSSWKVISICQCQDVGDPQARGLFSFDDIKPGFQTDVFPIL